MNYAALFQAVLPETLLVLTGFIILAADLALLRRQEIRARRKMAVMIGLGGLVVSGLWLHWVPGSQNLCGGILVIDPLGQMVKGLLLLLSAFTLLLFLDADFTRHVGEFVALLIFATVGLMLLVSSEDLLMIFLALELASLSLYTLTGFDRASRRSAEAALKYFMFGGVSAAFMLFGLSLLYGATGQTNLRSIAAVLAQARIEPVVFLALAMTLVGLGFKIAAAPFHMWAPDAYFGAPVPAGALIAAGSKVGSFVVLTKISMLAFAPAGVAGALSNAQPGWVWLLAGLAVISMLVGNLAALAQRNVRRLLAFSAIGQAGYALLGPLAGQTSGMASLVFFIAVYALSLVGAFAIIGLEEKRSGGCDLAHFAGLHRRDPLMALCLLVFMLSLAGIPPLGGFFGKFYLFAAALAARPASPVMLGLVALALGMSAVSLYYYLVVLKQAWVVESPEPEAACTPASPEGRIGVMMLALLVILTGLFPQTFLTRLFAAIAGSGL